MKDRLKELEKKKIVQEYSYTKTELEYKKTVIDENTKDFLNVAYTIAGKERQVSEEKNIQENENREKKIEESKIDESKIDSYIIKKSKKLYREISKRTHPDKDTQGLYTKIFIDATKSYEEFKLLDLYQHCEILGIQYEIEEEEIALFKKEIEINKNQIDSVEKTFIYVWSMQPDETMKDNIIKQFIKMMGDKM